MPQADIDALFSEWDADGSGAISLKELKAILKPPPAPAPAPAAVLPAPAPEQDTAEGPPSAAPPAINKHSLLVEKGVVKPLGEFETAIVGQQTALVITRGPDMRSPPIGQMAPGRELRLLQTMSVHLGLGVMLVRGRVAIDDHERCAELRELRPLPLEATKYPAGFSSPRRSLDSSRPGRSARGSHAGGDGTARSSMASARDHGAIVSGRAPFSGRRSLSRRSPSQ